MTSFTLQALTLSPIHLGDGSAWTPEAFKLEGDELLRFEPGAVVARMAPGMRKAFLRAIDAGDLKEAQRLVRDCADAELVQERIAISSETRRDIGQAVEDPQRSGRIHPFVRGGGRPILPGSAIKGAIRTALLSARAQDAMGRYRREVEQPPTGRREFGRWSGALSDRLQAEVLPARETDTDPFRFLRIADVTLPPGSTRFERVHNRKRDGRSNDMQMHFEALKPGTRFELRIDVDADAAERACGIDSRKAPRRPITPEELWRSIDLFYRGRWLAERDRFYRDAGLPEWPTAGPAGFPILLRVGRFSHFESASVEGLRRGWQRLPGGDARVVEEGSTRAVAMSGGRPRPFGWLMLAGQEAADVIEQIGCRFAAWFAEGAAVEVPGPHVRPGAGPIIRPGSRGTIDGEPVEVIEVGGPEIHVRFLVEGDTDWFPREKFKPQ